MRSGAGGVSYLYADQVSSTTNTSHGQTSSQLYYPYGDKRSTGSVATPYRYTGQRWESAIGLYFYNAQWYDPALGRFIQPDPIVPEPGNPQALNRYSYGLNNPVFYADPDGHNPLLGLMLIAAGGAALYVQHQQARAYAQAHDMTVWQAYCDPDFRTDEAAKVDAAIKGAFVVAATAIGVEAALSLGAATLMELGMQYDPSGQLFAKGLALNGLAARWDAFLLGHHVGNSLRLETERLRNTDPANLKMTKTVRDHLNDVNRLGGRARPYLDSSQLVRDIMQAQDPIPDPRGLPGGLRWDVPGHVNGKEGIYELVIDSTTDTIVHFLWRPIE